MVMLVPALVFILAASCCCCFNIRGKGWNPCDFVRTELFAIHANDSDEERDRNALATEMAMLQTQPNVDDNEGKEAF